MATEGTLFFWVAVWLGAAALVLVRHWRSDAGAGLIFTYVVSFAMTHWLAATLFLLPWHDARRMDYTVAGQRLTTLAVLALAAGIEIGAFLARRSRAAAGEDAGEARVGSRVVTLSILAGAGSYAVLLPLVGRLPTVGAIASTATSLVVVGVGLKCWNAWQAGHRVTMWAWLLATVAFPVVTLVGQGFLGFGFTAMLIVAAFVASFYRPRWQVVVAGALAAYVGSSVYVTYMRDRTQIRAVVWGGEAVSNRVDRLVETFGEMEWFDLRNNRHLDRIDTRLNQDFLIGAAVGQIEGRLVPLARGATMTDALIGMIPRALWPSKPTVAGSGDTVSTYTGLRFAEGTSVGVGHVMEFYVNFGEWGVVAGFYLLGVLLAVCDYRAGASLRAGLAGPFCMWYLPGLAILQLGGSFFELTTSAAAGWVVAAAFARMSRAVVESAPAPEVADRA
jgi:hypothetical protein